MRLGSYVKYGSIKTLSREAKASQNEVENRIY